MSSLKAKATVQMQQPIFRYDTNAQDFWTMETRDPGYSFGVFNPFEPHAIQFLRQVAALGPVRVAFGRKALFTEWQSTCIMMAQGFNTSTYHCEILFGPAKATSREQYVVFGTGGSHLSFYNSTMDPGCDWFELTHLPFSSAVDVLDLAVDMARMRVPYDDHFWFNVLGHSEDYDAERPETWKGMHCSQIVLLLLRRCIDHGVLPPPKTDELLRVCSHTCLPSDLLRMLCLLLLCMHESCMPLHAWPPPSLHA